MSTPFTLYMKIADILGLVVDQANGAYINFQFMITDLHSKNINSTAETEKLGKHLLKLQICKHQIKGLKI